MWSGLVWAGHARVLTRMTLVEKGKDQVNTSDMDDGDDEEDGGDKEHTDDKEDGDDKESYT